MLTRYGRLGASSRQRFFLFKEPLQRRGMAVAESPLLSDAYLRRLYGSRPMRRIEIAGRYVRRILALLRSSPADVVWLEKEALPWMPAWLEGLLIRRRTLVVDFDDGWHLRYQAGKSRWYARPLASKLEAIARRADTVVVANRELMQWARAAGASRIVHIPTVIDMERYWVTDEPPGPFTVGWIGSPLNLGYLEAIVRPLQRLSAEGARLLVIGAPCDFTLPGVNVEAVPWSNATEADDIARCHVGIMPLDDTPWERFKSGYKLLQYMAAGRAVVASPIGANLDIVRPGETGFLAGTDDDWYAALARLRDDAALRRRLATAGRRRCAEHFSLDAALGKIAQALGSARPSAPAKVGAGSVPLQTLEPRSRRV
jgi:glycosyltransferase involved in cell wall biosynthesis